MDRNVFDDAPHPVAIFLTRLGDFTSGNSVRQGQFPSQGVGEEMPNEGLREDLLLREDGVLESHDIVELMFAK